VPERVRPERVRPLGREPEANAVVVAPWLFEVEMFELYESPTLLWGKKPVKFTRL